MIVMHLIKNIINILNFFSRRVAVPDVPAHSLIVKRATTPPKTMEPRVFKIELSCPYIDDKVAYLTVD